MPTIPAAPTAPSAARPPYSTSHQKVLSTSNLIATLAALVTLGLGVYGYLQYVVAVRSYNVGPWKDCRDRLDVKNARVCRQYATLTYDDVATRRSFYASWQEALFISSEETAGGPNLTYHGNASWRSLSASRQEDLFIYEETAEVSNLNLPGITLQGDSMLSYYGLFTGDEFLLCDVDYDDLRFPLLQQEHGLWEYFLGDDNARLSLCAAGPPARSQVSTKPMADDRVRELRYQGMLHGSAAHVRSGQGTSTAPWLLLCILLGLLVLRSWSRPRGPSKVAPTVVSIMIFAKGVLASKVLQGNRPKLAPG